MPVLEKTGDIFSSQAEAVGHGVNTLGYMGAGIAAQFSRKFPVMYAQYKELCEGHRLKPGKVFVYHIPQTDRWVFNLASQKNPGADAQLYLVEESVANAFFIMDSLGITSIALPRIGSGIGGLNWDDVKAEIERVASYNPHITVELWTYDV